MQNRLYSGFKKGTSYHLISSLSESDLATLIKAVKRCAGAAKDALRAEGVTILQLNGKASE
jgi:diadenosine tetraphosphate (Ap4A) HIT family hydrolase